MEEMFCKMEREMDKLRNVVKDKSTSSLDGMIRRTKFLLSCSKLAIVPGDSLLNHTLVALFRMVGNALNMTPFGIIS